MKKLMACFLFSILIIVTCQAQQLTTYVTEWSGYGAKPGESGYQAYPFDGAYISQYRSHTKTTNSDMVKKSLASDVLAFAFMQVWNKELLHEFGGKPEWEGALHFDDLWGNLANAEVPEYAMWKKFCATSAFTPGTCASVQMDGNGIKKLFDYTTQSDLNIGQMNNFGAFLKLPISAHTKKIISIGGANTLDNHSISTQTFKTIFSNRTKFLNSLSQFINTLQTNAQTFDYTAISGVDYDFEPPINAEGGQLNPDASTLQDYKNLYNLVTATRKALGQQAYISVTITASKSYLISINQSVSGGWFKSIAPYVNAINIMTYDLHGPWSTMDDPGAISHVMLKHPKNLTHHYAIDYATQEVIDYLLSLGADPTKLQIGLASYGRAFANVVANSQQTYPGFDQIWNGAAHFTNNISNQDGLLPYRSVNSLLEVGYKQYDVFNSDTQTIIASYLYNSQQKIMVGYMSAALLKSMCDFIKAKNLQGAILWSMDTDADFNSSSANPSLIAKYDEWCRV